MQCRKYSKTLEECSLRGRWVHGLWDKLHFNLLSDSVFQKFYFLGRYQLNQNSNFRFTSSGQDLKILFTISKKINTSILGESKKKEVFSNIGPSKPESDSSSALIRKMTEQTVTVKFDVATIAQAISWVSSLLLTNITCGQPCAGCSITKISIWHFQIENVDMEVCSKHAEAHQKADWSIKHINVPKFLRVILSIVLGQPLTKILRSPQSGHWIFKDFDF